MVELASIYLAEGMALESVITLRRLVHERPEDPQSCSWLALSVAAAVSSGSPTIAAQQAVALGEQWSALADRAPSPARTPCREQTESLLQEVATTLHPRARRDGRASSFDAADRVFRESLHRFPSEPSAPAMRYHHAELQLEHGHVLYAAQDTETRRRALDVYQEAHQDFVDLLDEDPTGPHHARAAYAQLLALRHAQERTDTPPRLHACKVDSTGVCVYRARKVKKRRKTKSTNESDPAIAEPPPLPFSEAEQALLAAYDRFEAHVDIAAEHPQEAPRIDYRRAFLMVRRNRFEQARPLLERLVVEHDGTKWAAWGATLLLDQLTMEWLRSRGPEAAPRARDELESWVERLPKMKLWGHREAQRLREQVPSLMAGLLWQKAEYFREQERYEECGEQFVAIRNRFDEHDRADSLLFNAARCFDHAHQVGNAIQVREALLADYPESAHARQTLLELAQIYEALAEYPRAAQRYEQFAEAYRKDSEAAPALAKAYVFRRALGQRDRATENLTRYESLFARRDVGRAATVFWSQSELLDDSKAREAHAREYIARYGSKGGIDRLAVAHATLGRELWRTSCVRPAADGTCVTMKYAAVDASPGEFCTARRVTALQIGRRRKVRAERAQEHLTRAVELAERVLERPLDPARQQALVEALAMARVLAAQPAYEAFLRETSASHGTTLTELRDLHERLDPELEELKVAYREIFELGHGPWAGRAAWQWTLAHDRLGDELRIEVPETKSGPSERSSYCKRKRGPADALHEAATQALQFCVERAMQGQSFGPFARACEQELQRRKPKEYPPTYELFDRSRYTHAPMVPVGVQLEPQPSE